MRELTSRGTTAASVQLPSAPFARQTRLAPCDDQARLRALGGDLGRVIDGVGDPACHAERLDMRLDALRLPGAQAAGIGPRPPRPSALDAFAAERPFLRCLLEVDLRGLVDQEQVVMAFAGALSGTTRLLLSGGPLSRPGLARAARLPAMRSLVIERPCLALRLPRELQRAPRLRQLVLTELEGPLPGLAGAPQAEAPAALFVEGAALALAVAAERTIHRLAWDEVHAWNRFLAP